VSLNNGHASEKMNVGFSHAALEKLERFNKLKQTFFLKLAYSSKLARCWESFTFFFSSMGARNLPGNP